MNWGKYIAEARKNKKPCKGIDDVKIQIFTDNDLFSVFSWTEKKLSDGWRVEIQKVKTPKKKMDG